MRSPLTVASSQLIEILRQQVVQLNAPSPERARQNSLVSVTKYVRGATGPPLAVGRLVVDATTLVSMRKKDEKGKAVKVLHVHGDKLWEMGRRSEPPDPIPVSTSDVAQEESASDGEHDEDVGKEVKKNGLKERVEEPSASPSPASEIGRAHV